MACFRNVLSAFVVVALFAAVVFVALLARTRLWWLPSSAAIAGGVALVIDAAQPYTDDPFWAVVPIGHLFLWVVALGVVALGALLFAATWVFHHEHAVEPRPRGSSELPIARVIR